MLDLEALGTLDAAFGQDAEAPADRPSGLNLPDASVPLPSATHVCPHLARMVAE